MAGKDSGARLGDTHVQRESREDGVWEQLLASRPAPTHLSKTFVHAMNPDNLKLLALDLTRACPRSPRDMLAGYVIAARTLDKCRAMLNGTLGEYHFDCSLDRQFLSFAGIQAEAFKDFVATGASDSEVADWIQAKAKTRPRIEVILWNNQMRSLRLCDLPESAQEFLEEYVPKFLPPNRPVYVWFDVYDLEEKRM